MFIVFKSYLTAKHARRNPQAFIDTINSDKKLVYNFNINNWHITKAPPESDIFWFKLGKKDFISSIKSFVLFLLLFIVCVVLVSPLTVSMFTLY